MLRLRVGYIYRLSMLLISVNDTTVQLCYIKNLRERHHKSLHADLQWHIVCLCRCLPLQASQRCGYNLEWSTRAGRTGACSKGDQILLLWSICSAALQAAIPSSQFLSTGCCYGRAACSLLLPCLSALPMSTAILGLHQATA